MSMLEGHFGAVLRNRYINTESVKKVYKIFLISCLGSPQPAFVEIRTCPGTTTTSTSQATTTTTQTTTTTVQTTTTTTQSVTTTRPATAVAPVTLESNTQASATSTTVQPATTYQALVDAPVRHSLHLTMRSLIK